MRVPDPGKKFMSEHDYGVSRGLCFHDAARLSCVQELLDWLDDEMHSPAGTLNTDS